MSFPLPQRNTDPRIDISPLIDVVFQLLIFFVVTTTFLSDTGIPLELPEAASGEEQAVQEELSVRIARDGAISLSGEVVSLTDLETRLRQEVERRPREALTIYGDGQVDYETIIKVMDVARRVQAPGIVLATDQPPTPPPR